MGNLEAEDQETDSNKCRTPTPLPKSQKSKQTQVTKTNTWDGAGWQLSGRVLAGMPRHINKPRCKKNSSSLLQARSLDSQMTCGLPQGHWAGKFLLSSRLAEVSRSKLWGSYYCQERICRLPVKSHFVRETCDFHTMLCETRCTDKYWHTAPPHPRDWRSPKP